MKITRKTILRLLFINAILVIPSTIYLVRNYSLLHLLLIMGLIVLVNAISVLLFKMHDKSEASLKYIEYLKSLNHFVYSDIEKYEDFLKGEDSKYVEWFKQLQNNELSIGNLKEINELSIKTKGHMTKDNLTEFNKSVLSEITTFEENEKANVKVKTNLLIFSSVFLFFAAFILSIVRYLF